MTTLAAMREEAYRAYDQEAQNAWRRELWDRWCLGSRVRGQRRRGPNGTGGGDERGLCRQRHCPIRHRLPCQKGHRDLASRSRLTNQANNNKAFGAW